MQTQVTLLYGGTDAEREISFQTQAVVKAYLDTQENFIYNTVEIAQDGTWMQDGKAITPEQALKWTDYAFIAMHGAYGEDGQIQKILEHQSVPYNGADSLWSRLCFSKAATKDLFAQLDIKTPAWETRGITDIDPGALAGDIFQNFPQPCVIKLIRGSSSVGVSLAETKEQIREAITQAQSLTDNVIVEEYIKGREASVCVVEGLREEPFYSLPPAEMISHNRLFDYGAKYNGQREIMCPSSLSDEVKKELQGLAQNIHKNLNLSDYSRSDFIIHPERGIFALEVDTLPELHRESAMEKMLQAVGSSADEVIELCIKKNKS